jgi:hypothetical protein
MNVMFRLLYTSLLARSITRDAFTTVFREASASYGGVYVVVWYPALHAREGRQRETVCGMQENDTRVGVCQALDHSKENTLSCFDIVNCGFRIHQITEKQWYFGGETSVVTCPMVVMCAFASTKSCGY